MIPKRFGQNFLLILILIVSVGCKEQKTTLTPTTSPPPQAPAFSTPTPTSLPANTAVPSLITDAVNLPPKIVGQSPAASEELLLDGLFEVYFDQPMDRQATAVAWQVVDDQENPVVGQVSWPQPRILRFQPDRKLKPNAHYKAVLGETAVNTQGSPLLESLTLDFYTIGDLSVSQASPPAGASGVAGDTVITVIFSRPVVPLTNAESRRAMANPLAITPETAGQGEWVSTSVYLFRPEERLIGRQTYTVQVQADVINQSNVTSAQMINDYEFSFTVTAPTLNALELVDREWSPGTNYHDLLLDQALRFHFNQPMNPGSAETAVSLTSSTNQAVVPLQFGWNETQTAVTITPTQQLELDTRYTLQLAATAQSARGGTLAEDFSWDATTIPPPAITSTDPADGTTQFRFFSTFTLTFVSPMDADSLAGKVTITPAPRGDADGQYNSWGRHLRFYGLAPSTTYTVQIGSGMADIYGHEITTEKTVTFTTAAQAPTSSFNMPYQLALYRRGGSDSLWISHRNVEQLDVDLFNLSLSQFGRLLHGDLSSLRFVPDSSQHIWSQSVSIETPLNQLAHERFELNLEEGANLPTGFYFAALDSPQIRHNEAHLQGAVALMSTANVTLKTTASEVMIWVTDLNSGQPLPNVPVAFYDTSGNLIFGDVTDANGLVYHDDLVLKTDYRTHYYAVAGQEGDDLFGVAISRWDQGISPYDFGIRTDYYLQPGEPTVYVYTDRPIYRPGQPVYFKGIMRLNDDLVYSLPQAESVKIEIASYDEIVYTEDVPLSEFGSFTGQIELDDEATLGGYRISVITSGDQQIGSGYFDVAEYRKPTFQVEVTAVDPDVAVGDTITLEIAANFFSGGAVVAGDVAWHVRSTPYTLRGEGVLRRFSFNNQEQDLGYYSYYGRYQSTETIAQGTGTTDAQGQLSLEIPAELSDGDGSQRFTIEATVTDIANNQVSGRTEVLVHRSHVYPGIAATQRVGKVGEPAEFSLAVLDWDKEPVANQLLSVEIVERRWYSVQEEDDRGRTIWRSSVEEIPVDVLGSAELVSDGNGRATISFIPPKGGVYRATVSTQDAQGNQTRASNYVWVSGRSYVPWRRMNDHSFELISDLDSYSPGDTAEILIASPFQGEVSALVTVERGHIQQHEVIQLVNNSTIYRLPITGDMAPNVFVSVLVMKGVDDTSLAPNFKLGMTQFTVDREEQELKVEIIPDQATVAPGDTVNYTVRVLDFAGQPVAAEVSLSLSDLAALSLADRKERAILDHFYSTRWLSVNTALLLAFNMDAYNKELEDEIKGGGGGAGSYGILKIREDFPDTAYWEGQLQTGPDGIATVAVTLPDNLTTWRMDVRAVTVDTKVGQSTTDIMSTRPLLVSPLTQRFFVVGDRAQLATAVHNNTDLELETAVALQAQGVVLHTPETQTISIPARQQAVVTWQATVENVERVDLVFTASSGDYVDASRPMLGTLEGNGIPVYRYEVSETVGTSGQLLESGAVIEAISLPIYSDFEFKEGGLTVEIAPSLSAAMTDGLDYLSHYEHECTEQIVSRFLPNLLSVRALKIAELDDPDLQANLDAQVNVALQRLYGRQRADGGWPWWDGPHSNTLVTAYVVLSLLEARESGYLVSDEVFNQGVAYLSSHLSRGDGLNGRYKQNRQAFLVYVLARAERPPVNIINNLYEERASLDLYARGFLAQALHLIDPQDPRLAALVADFISHATISATGTSWEESERDYWNWNSDTRTTAIVLDTMLKLNPQNPLVANAVRWLMAHRVNGRWRGTQETAWTLMALTNWMSTSGELEADFQYEVALNGNQLALGTAQADNLRDSIQLQVDMAELLTDTFNGLAIGRDDGPGNLYYTAHLQLPLPVEEVQSLDQGIIVSRSYYDPANPEQPITEIAQGETVQVRLTIVAPNTLHYVLIEDFLPAGLEGIDQSLKTSQQVGAPLDYDWNRYFEQGWGWWIFDHIELKDEKVTLSADHLPAGTYEYVYLARAAMPGTYHVIPPTAQEFYFPEVNGRGAGSMFVVSP